MDIWNFARNQLEQMREPTNLDWNVIKTAMNSKLRDNLRHATNLRAECTSTKKDLLQQLGGKKFKLKRILKRIKNELVIYKTQKTTKHEAKIEHYLRKYREDHEKLTNNINPKNPTLDNITRPYAEITALRGEELDKQADTGPFIAHDSIQLTEDEKDLLARNPKFALRKGVSEHGFMLESEKMLSKLKYGWEEKLDTTVTSDTTSGLEVKTSDLNSLWLETQGRATYDMETQTVDFTKLLPSDYKLNRNISLPKPLPKPQEMECEFIREGLRDVFRKYKELMESRMKQKRDKKNKNKNKNRNNINKNIVKNNKDENYIPNLTAAQNRGLKSILKKIKAGHLVVCPTDKSGRLAVLTREQYIQAGKVHTQSDKRINWKQVKTIQENVNDHMWWYSNIFKMSESTNQNDRMTKNIIDHGHEVCNMSILLKDHKGWSPASGTPPPTRPVISGNGGLNVHLSEFISSLVEPLANVEDGSEINSTSDMLARLTRHNSSIKADYPTSNDLLDPTVKDDPLCLNRAKKAKMTFPTDNSANISSTCDYLESLLDENDCLEIQQNVRTEITETRSSRGDGLVECDNLLEEERGNSYGQGDGAVGSVECVTPSPTPGGGAGIVEGYNPPGVVRTGTDNLDEEGSRKVGQGDGAGGLVECLTPSPTPSGGAGIVEEITHWGREGHERRRQVLVLCLEGVT